jgi:site-specific DNA recombinase
MIEMKAAIYCRVSTEGQEQEGTSLQTQFEACQKYCRMKKHEIGFHFRNCSIITHAF